MARGRFREIFWQPPRAHGDVIEDRSVSYLELFNDLVFVVVISRATLTLAAEPTWQSAGRFAVIFGMIWLAWLNGTFYYDLHGREDGRTRAYVFVQMLLLALLAVYTGDAAGDEGRGFAIVYTLLLLVMTWLWYTVRRQDAEEYMAITGRYLVGMVISVTIVGISIFLPNEARLVAWAVLIVMWVAGGAVLTGRASRGGAPPPRAGDSLIERFGLFVIIVLGEVVVGVVTGLSDANRDPVTIVTGAVGLMIGFGIWWTYFDFVGRRRPRDGAGAFAAWTTLHLPITMAIAASGAAMVSLIDHAEDARAPASTAWLLTGSIALVLVALIATAGVLADRDRLATVYRPLTGAMAVAAVVVLGIGWWRPAPWLLVTLLVVVLFAVWLVALTRWLRLEDPGAAAPG